MTEEQPNEHCGSTEPVHAQHKFMRGSTVSWCPGRAVAQPGRRTADTITDDELDALYDALARGHAELDRWVAADALPQTRRALHDVRAALGRPAEAQPATAGHRGGNAEDCPACGTNPPYPFLCPGPPVLGWDDQPVCTCTLLIKCATCLDKETP